MKRFTLVVNAFSNITKQPWLWKHMFILGPSISGGRTVYSSLGLLVLIFLTICIIIEYKILHQTLASVYINHKETT